MSSGCTTLQDEHKQNQYEQLRTLAILVYTTSTLCKIRYLGGMPPSQKINESEPKMKLNYLCAIII